MFPIKRKTTNQSKKKIVQENLQPPLGKIEEESESQSYLASTTNFQLASLDK